MNSKLELVYWPGLPGRAEFVRLVFEYLRVPFVDTRDAKRVLAVQSESTRAFAPPFLLKDGLVFSQTAAIASQIAEDWSSPSANKVLV
jgi:glutathione S-transferase